MTSVTPPPPPAKEVGQDSIPVKRLCRIFHPGGASCLVIPQRSGGEWRHRLCHDRSSGGGSSEGGGSSWLAGDMEGGGSGEVVARRLPLDASYASEAHLLSSARDEENRKNKIGNLFR